LCIWRLHYRVRTCLHQEGVFSRHPPLLFPFNPRWAPRAGHYRSKCPSASHVEGAYFGNVLLISSYPTLRSWWLESFLITILHMYEGPTSDVISLFWQVHHLFRHYGSYCRHPHSDPSVVPLLLLLACLEACWPDISQAGQQSTCRMSWSATIHIWILLVSHILNYWQSAYVSHFILFLFIRIFTNPCFLIIHIHCYVLWDLGYVHLDMHTFSRFRVSKLLLSLVLWYPFCCIDALQKWCQKFCPYYELFFFCLSI